MKTGLARSKWLILLIISALVAFNSCKKDGAKPSDRDGNSGNSGGTGQLADEDSLKFYVWWINESDSENVPLYYWYDQVSPADPLSSRFSTGEDVMNYIRSFPEVNGEKVDRYSFLDRTGAVSGELEGGVLGDFGFDVGLVYDGPTADSRDVGIYILYVYPGSPAAEKGIEKGWKIASYNGVSTEGLTDASNLDAVSDAIYRDASTTFTFQEEDGTVTPDIALAKKTYHINPVLFDSVYTVKNEKVGYFVYNSFVSVGSGANGAQAKQEIEDVFNKFKTAGVKDLIVDLRYNGGGAVVSTEYLDNLIAPASTAGQEMYKTIYNDQLTDAYNYLKANGNTDQKAAAALALDPVNFSSVPYNLNLNRVFFIVSRNTASASELTINNLKPYMNVKLIGDTTYGKPVGFFPISIEFVTDTAGYAHVADMYAINFQSVNKNGQGDYYSGMAPDYHIGYFQPLNWGDTRDDRLKSALNYIENGSFERFGASERKTKQQGLMRQVKRQKLVNPNQFNGMVDYRKKTDIKNLLKK